MGGFRIEPPPGGAFTACTPSCFLDGGGVVFISPSPAGAEAKVNARANVTIPSVLSAVAFEPAPSGILDGPQHDFRFGVGIVGR